MRSITGGVCFNGTPSDGYAATSLTREAWVRCGCCCFVGANCVRPRNNCTTHHCGRQVVAPTGAVQFFVHFRVVRG
ncbi:MAG: hypothetical protein FWB93_00870 [Oscillospiraceae bacterium]|nr:hypothetical protein [Oscillospiraceae bacterium]